MPADSRGQFFTIEQYFLNDEQTERRCRQFCNILMKLNCYEDIAVCGLIRLLHLHDPGGIIRLIGFQDLCDAGTPQKLGGKERHSHFHARVEIRHNGTEDRGNGNSGNGLHFLQVLVLLGQAVLPRRLVQRIPVRGFIFRDHFLPAAGVPGQGEAAERRVGADQPGRPQRRHQGDEARGVAAGVGDAL